VKKKTTRRKGVKSKTKRAPQEQFLIPVRIIERPRDVARAEAEALPFERFRGSGLH
jgi:hypothetical protein